MTDSNPPPPPPPKHIPTDLYTQVACAIPSSEMDLSRTHFGGLDDHLRLLLHVSSLFPAAL